MFFLLTFLTVFSTSAKADTSNMTEINIDLYKTNRQWKTPPTVLICNSSNFSKENINAAVKEWSKKGNTIKKIEYENSNNKCTFPGKKGHIQIMGQGKHLNTHNHYAITSHRVRHYKNGKEEIIFTNIETAKDTYNRYSTTLHEFGHAFGYYHNHIQGDVMNRK